MVNPPPLEQDLEALRQFAYTAWTDPDALWGTLPSRGVEYLSLGEYLDALRELCGGLLMHDKILVRAEYRDILRELKENREYERGAYVIGQPGIGKTYFLIYLLVERLREHKPVAFQHLNGQPFYVLFTDTVALYSFHDKKPLLNANDVWALTDCGAVVTQPAPVFLSQVGRGLRVIQATSPRADHWKAWSKQYNAGRCVMNIWSEREIGDLASLRELNVETMTALATKWGGVPRTLLNFYRKSESEIEDEILDTASSAITYSPRLIPSLGQLDAEELGIASMFFVLPLKDHDGHLQRSLPPRACVPTETLVNALGKALQGRAMNVKLAFFQVMQAHPGTRRDGANIYKRWLHPFFLSGQEIECNWHAEGAKLRSLPATVWTTTSLICSTESALENATAPFYWIATPKFPGIDSVLVTENEIIVFQTTIASEYLSPQSSLDKLRGLLPKRLKNLNWRVLYVGMEEQQTNQVSMGWVRELTIETAKNRAVVPVGWAVVDPVEQGIVYDESTSTVGEHQATEVDEE